MADSSLLDAAKHGRADEVKQLLLLGASVNEQDYNNAGSALYWACCSGSDAAVRLLLNAGSEVNAPNVHKHSPLHAAADKGHSTIVQLLLQSGAAVNARNSEGLTPLHLASYRGYSAIVTLLLRAGADMTILSNDNKTAFHEARAQKHLDVIEAMRLCELRPTSSSITAPSAGLRHPYPCNDESSASDGYSIGLKRSGRKPDLTKKSLHRTQQQVPLKKTMSTPPLPCSLTRKVLPAKRDYAKASINSLDDDGVSVLLDTEPVSLGVTTAVSLIDFLPLYSRSPQHAGNAKAVDTASAPGAANSAATTAAGAFNDRCAIADRRDENHVPVAALRCACERLLSAHCSSRPPGVRCLPTLRCPACCESPLSTSESKLTDASAAVVPGTASSGLDSKRIGKPVVATAAVADNSSTAEATRFSDSSANATDRKPETFAAADCHDLRYCLENFSGVLSSRDVDSVAELDGVATSKATGSLTPGSTAVADCSPGPQWHTSGNTDESSNDDFEHQNKNAEHLREGELLQVGEVAGDSVVVSSQLFRGLSVDCDPEDARVPRQPRLRRHLHLQRSSEGLLTVGSSQQPTVPATSLSVSQRFRRVDWSPTEDDAAFPQYVNLPHRGASAASDSAYESEERHVDFEAASAAEVSAPSLFSAGGNYSLVDGEPFAVIRDRGGSTQLLFRITSILSFAYTLKVILDVDHKLFALIDATGCIANVTGEVACGLQFPSVPPHPHIARILASYCGDGSNFARMPATCFRGCQAAIGERRTAGGRRSSESDDAWVHSSSCDETAGGLLSARCHTGETRLDGCRKAAVWPQTDRAVPALFYVMPGGYVHTLGSFIRWSRDAQPSPPYGVDASVYLRIVYEVLLAVVHLRQTASLCHCAVTPDAIYLTADLHAAVGDVEACICLRSADGSLIACNDEALLRGSSRSGNLDYYWWAPELERHVLRWRIGRHPNEPTYAHVLHEKCDTYSIGRTMYAVMGSQSTEIVKDRESTSTIAFPAISRAKLCYSDDETPDLVDGCINRGCYPPNLRALLRCLVRDAASRPTAAQALAWAAEELSSVAYTRAALNAADVRMTQAGLRAESEASVRQRSTC